MFAFPAPHTFAKESFIIRLLTKPGHVCLQTKQGNGNEPNKQLSPTFTSTSEHRLLTGNESTSCSSRTLFLRQAALQRARAPVLDPRARLSHVLRHVTLCRLLQRAQSSSQYCACCASRHTSPTTLVQLACALAGLLPTPSHPRGTVPPSRRKEQCHLHGMSSSHANSIRTAGALTLPLCAALPLPAAMPLGAAADTCRRPSSTTVTLPAAAVSWGVRTRPPRPASCAATTRASARISAVRALRSSKSGNHINFKPHALCFLQHRPQQRSTALNSAQLGG